MDKNRGIVLMNLGSPASTEVSDVHRYLMQFLMDGRVIDYPYLFRKMLVGGIIVPRRAAKSAEAYRTIWTKEGSPLVVLTRQLQEAVQCELEEPVEIAMRYGEPDIESAFLRLSTKVPGLREVLAIALYPHYAMSSYETAVMHARATHARKKYAFKLDFIRPYFDEQHYIDALSESIRPYLAVAHDHILFSYHGIPGRHVRKTDPTGGHCLKVEDCCELSSLAHRTCYRHQVFTTTRLVREKLNISEAKSGISFQSRLGRGWLEPFTDMRFVDMPREGIKKLLVVCPSFVSDCLETLEEIEIRGRESFLQAGGESFQMIPCLNTSPGWVQAIAAWVGNYGQGDKSMLLDL